MVGNFGILTAYVIFEPLPETGEGFFWKITTHVIIVTYRNPVQKNKNFCAYVTFETTVEKTWIFSAHVIIETMVEKTWIFGAHVIFETMVGNSHL